MGKPRSKKQSSTKAQPEPTFFADRNLGREFAKILREAGFKVVVHDDHFDQSTEDVDWLPVVTRNGWIALSKDKDLRKDELEVRCILKCGARVFVAGGKQKPADFAGLIIQSRASILRYIRRREKHNPGPFVARLSRDQKRPDTRPAAINIWLDQEKWEKRQRKIRER